MNFSMEYRKNQEDQYLEMLNEQLRYIFSNLDEENFSDDISRKYARKDERFSIIEANTEKISWVIADGEKESEFSITPRMSELLSDNIVIEGIVKFTDLSGEGTTTIHGSNIVTGEISAEMIKGGTLAATTLSGGTITGTKIVGANITGGTIKAGEVNGSNYVGGVLDINGRLYADVNRTRIGDFFVSFNKAYHFQDIKYKFIVDAGVVNCVSVTTDSTGETYSDRRLKENIKQIDGEKAYQFIKNLRAVTYRRIDTGEDEVGFIAQEVEEELKKMDLDWPIVGENGYKTISYESFVPVIAAAVKWRANDKVRRKQNKTDRQFVERDTDNGN